MEALYGAGAGRADAEVLEVFENEAYAVEYVKTRRAYIAVYEYVK